MPVVILRQQHRRAEINRVTPPLAEDRALDDRFTCALSVGGWIGGITLSATSLIGVLARGSKETRTGSP